MQTILLDTVAWDLVADANNNIAVASDPYSQAQDAASAERTFLGECWYNTLLGVPWYSEILGLRPPLSLVKAKLIAAAKTVPGVTAAACFISSFKNRQVAGQVQITNLAGKTSVASF